MYLKKRFGKRTLKICVDGNFTCPNRDGTKGIGGCIFCGSSGSGENIKGKCEDTLDSIKNQVNLFLNSYRGLRAEQFIIYFQSFSGTYDSIENLNPSCRACNFRKGSNNIEGFREEIQHGLLCC